MNTIAIIDDDVYIGDMLEKVLRKEGYGVLRAYSGTEALFLLEKKCPDLILLDGAADYLTKTEYAILKLLIQNPNQVITKSAILDRISEDTPDCMESSLKMHVSNLRKKLREVSGHDFIEAVWGIGFKLV